MKIATLPFAAAAFVVIATAGAVAGGNLPNFTAVVDSAGNLARGYRAVSATRLALGKYQVNFEKSVSACSYTASVGLPGSAGSELFGVVGVSPRAGKPKSIIVQTYDIAGESADRGFHVIVAC